MISRPAAGTRPPSPSRREIEAWLVTRLAEELGIAAVSIDVEEPFEAYGLDSVKAVGLSGELEQWLARPLSPTLAYDYPTIEALARHLAEESGPPPSSPEAPLEFRREPIAIVGIGCRFPGAAGPDAFWRLLVQGVDAIREVPPDRWDLRTFYDPDPAAPGKMVTRWAGLLERVDQFDARFFGISPLEAARMDPQQRLLLEVAWEALEHGGQLPERLRGSRTSVFIGISTNDYGRLQLSNPDAIDAYAGTGNALSIAANRLSYVFDLRGPSMAIDTACSSSLVAVHLACASLWAGESELALAGGVNVVLSPALAINFTKAGAMAPDGRCKTFDARADGYVRGEGVGVVVLKPLTRALADGDPIHAVIRGSAVNQDGRTNGLMAPSRQAQEAVLREAYRRAGVAPGSVQYVEAHGTGTFLGDPIEAAALASVLGEGRAADRRCAIGSVKTNIGHLEAAAGIAGLIKAALALGHQQIPPSLHFEQPNPHIPFERLPLRVARSLEPWPQGPGPAVAGISSFGFGGTNVHVILEAPPVAVAAEPPAEAAGPGHSYVLPISARTETAVRALATAYRELATNEAACAPHWLRDACCTAGVRRSHHAHRLALTIASREQLVEGLDAFLSGRAHPALAIGRRARGLRRRVVFVFPGTGSQWPGMGRELVDQEPLFRTMIERCDVAMRADLRWSLLRQLMDDALVPRLDAIDVFQPALFAIAVALAALWRSWGIEPDAVVGHSMGEVAAAHVAGALSLEDAARIVCRRSRSLRRMSGRGAMALVDLSWEAARHAVADSGDRLVVAARNSPTSSVLAGDRRALEALLETLQRQGVFCRLLPVDVASHSPQMDPLRGEILEILDGIVPQTGSTPIYSTVSGAMIDGRALDAAYWARNLREPVLFSDAVQRLLEDGHDLFVEISPQPVLLGAIQQGLSQRGREGVLLPSLRRGEAERGVLLRSLGGLYAAGFDVEWARLYPTPARCVPLPPYPWQHERYWLDIAPPETQALAVGGDREAAAAAWQDWLYEVAWQPEAPPNSVAPPLEASRGPWIVFADAAGTGRELAALLTQHGETCVLVYPGRAYAKRGDSFEVRPGHEDDLRRLFEATLGPEQADCRGLVHLWSLDLAPVAEASTVSWDEVEALGCRTALRVIQRLARATWRQPPRLWLVTRGAQPVRPGRVEVAQAPLWGFGRVIAEEHPQLWGGLVDLDPDVSLERAAAMLHDVLGTRRCASQIAFREAARYVPRLVPRSGLVRRAAPTLRADGTYLITGGLGALGLAVARWMAEQGARRLILIGRSPLPPRADWGREQPGTRLAEQIAGVRGLEARGVAVRVAGVDVADAAALAALLDDLRRDRAGPIRGVVHAAGILDDRLLHELDDAAVTAVLRPKMQGAWLLDRLLADEPLDFFVLFSSAASLLGQPGQANYAAANAFLDALAHDRYARGLPALSISWGMWHDLGLAATRGGQRLARQLAHIGVAGIPLTEGLVVLGQLMAGGPPHTVVLAIDWSRYRESYAAGNDTPLLAGLVTGPTPPVGNEDLVGGDPLTRAALLAAAPEERWALVERRLRDQVARVVGLAAGELDPDEPLSSLGLDSLMAVRLKNRLELELGVTVSLASFLEGASVRDLARQVIEAVVRAASAPPALPAGPSEAERLLAVIDELSDEKVDTLLRTMLAEDGKAE